MDCIYLIDIELKSGWINLISGCLSLDWNGSLMPLKSIKIFPGGFKVFPGLLINVQNHYNQSLHDQRGNIPTNYKRLSNSNIEKGQPTMLGCVESAYSLEFRGKIWPNHVTRYRTKRSYVKSVHT